jgi:Amiloride-sensitive sodium channel
MTVQKQSGPKSSIRVFFEESSIHGFSYLTDKNISFFEKVFWFFAIIASITCCSILISQIVIKLNDDLLIIFSSENAIQITEISFPAVTFCGDLLNAFSEFDHRKISKSLSEGEITIDNLTESE